jgi:hypothetical protein
MEMGLPENWSTGKGGQRGKLVNGKVVNAERWSTENWSTGKKAQKYQLLALNKKVLI